MKHKEDIYKKPEKSLSEYATVILVGTTIVLFSAFEVYTLSSQESVTVVQKDKCKQQDTLLSTTNLDTVNTEHLVLAKNDTNKSVEQNPVTISTKTLEPKVELPKNPFDTLITMSSEVAFWKLYETYSDYSVQQQKKLLYYAVENNHANNLTSMLEKGYTFETGNYEGDTNKLIINRKYQVVIVLIKKKLLDIKKVNDYGYSILHEAASKGHQYLIRLMVAQGVDINQQAKDGVSALHYPTRLGYGITVSTLLELGINPNLQATLKYSGLYWNKSTPLHIACKRGHIKLVKKLLKGNADQTIKDGDGMTALQWAEKLQHKAIIELLTPVEKAPEVIGTETKPVLDTNVSEKIPDTNSSLVIKTDPLQESEEIKIDEIAPVSAGEVNNSQISDTLTPDLTENL
jgi:uncharacterized protein